MTRIVRAFSASFIVSAAAVLLAACGGAPAETARPFPVEESEPAARTPERAPAASTPEPAPAAAAPAPACSEGGHERLRSDRLAYAAVVRRTAPAYREPGRAQLARFETRNVNGVPTVLGVLSAVVGPDCEPRWYRVQLPMKPNGITGYVRASDVDVYPIRTRIVVELTARRVMLFRDGSKLIETTAAIGSPATPTPVGSFYVNQRLRPKDRSGPFGPGAIGISAFSEVLTGWAQGGPVALHGTNRPDLIGGAVSNGCIRLRNDVLERMFRLALPGTPVLVRA